jgi:hypothetical protein
MEASGTILGLDDAGFIVKRASVERIQPAWRAPLGFAVANCAGVFGPALTSVYVRWSVPLGQAREYVSDIDTFCLVEGDADGDNAGWTQELRREVTQRWPFVESVELSVFPVSQIGSDRILAGTIKTQSACVFGSDVAADIPGCRPGIEMFAHGWDLPRDLATARHHLRQAGGSEPEKQSWANWALKRLIRSGFELVMERAGCFTRDLRPCCSIFGRYYPEQAASMEDALSLAIRRGCDSREFDSVTHQIGDWLHEEMVATYGAARIEQLLQHRLENELPS